MFVQIKEKGNFYMLTKGKKPFQRPCKKCGEMFQPPSRYSDLCMACRERINLLRAKFFKKKKENKNG